MKRWKLTLLIIGFVFACLIILPEFGLFDVNFALLDTKLTKKSTKVMSSPINEKFSSYDHKVRTNQSDNKNFSYHLIIKNKQETILNLTHLFNNLPVIEIEGIMDEPEYFGNYYLPLVKMFSIKYKCTFKTTKSPDGRTLEGKTEGNVTVKIYGLYSHLKAKELAFGKAKEAIEAFF